MNNTTTTDTKKTPGKWNAKFLALIGLMTAIICILSPFSIYLTVSPVPITLGLMAIYFTVTILGMKKGTLSVLIYILLGLVGLPVFSGFTGGPGKLFGPTGGYIIGYIFSALIIGFFVDKWNGKWYFNLIGMLLGTAVCYLFGTAWLAFQLSLTFPEALMMGVIPYIPADLIKIALVLLIGIPVRKALLRANLI
ncbi:MAG: biotin transporter BioY [Lachnospiraceae bacterium]